MYRACQNLDYGSIPNCRVHRSAYCLKVTCTNKMSIDNLSQQCQLRTAMPGEASHYYDIRIKYTVDFDILH